ncbi:disease resistance protein RGA2-like [Gossypium australe]|uniref:Disease resistance protein RGA2-like n=1 Tax=Gossypium australe TaxID=47621 RepID=A0A5B6VT75_9ROSI|nr:disease resistance protein RGA2-like [Gossypium australe]
MPFGIDKLISLQRLFDFILGESDGHHIRVLKYLSNLKGDFRLSGLGNVNCQDAREAKLNEKQGIDRLVLHWSKNFYKDSRNKEDEEWVLGSPCPPKKLEQLVIENYGGAKFFTWIADSSFKNVLSLVLRNCKNYKSLPSVARLSLLKDLSICGLDELHKIGVELFGAYPYQSNAFTSLETTLEIYECGRLVVSISYFSSLCELIIDGCEELVDEGSSSAEEVTSLKSMFLRNISKFDISAEKALLRFANSEAFDISGWKEFGIFIAKWSITFPLLKRDTYLGVQEFAIFFWFTCFLNDRFLLDKAIDLIDEAGSRVRLCHAQLPEEAKDLEKELWAQITAIQEKDKEMNKGVEGSLVVTEADIQHIVSSWTGIPVENISTDESDRLLKMEETLHKPVVDQDEAAKAISPVLLWFMGFQHLTSLQQLHPENDMLLSLEHLLIYNCLLLEEGFSRRKGREWSKVAHISYVQIDVRTVIPRGLD